MNRKSILLFVFVLLTLSIIGCARSGQQVVELKHFPLDSLKGVITTGNVSIDKDISSDGKGSLRAAVTGNTVIRLFEVKDIDVDNARLIYQVKLRTKDLKGKAYLEMWCHFPGKGEFFSRGLQAPLTGTTNWTTEETPFFLKKGQKPDYVKLNLVIDGSGTVWIDDIRLLKAPLK